MIRLGQGAIGGNQQGFQAFLPGADVAELPRLIAHQLLDGRAAQRTDRDAGGVEQRLKLGVRQVGDVLKIIGGCLGQERRGGVAVDEFEDPAGGDVLDEQGEFGEGESKEMVELVDEPRALPDDGLESAGDLAQGAKFGVHRRGGDGPFGEGEARGGAGFDGVGLLAAEEGGTIVFVALRIAAGDENGEGRRASGASRGSGEGVQEVQQVVGVLAGGIEADDEGDIGVTLGEALQALPQGGIADGGLGELQLGGGGLEIVAEEGGIMAVARGVDADADAGHLPQGWRRC